MLSTYMYSLLLEVKNILNRKSNKKVYNNQSIDEINKQLEKSSKIIHTYFLIRKQSVHGQYIRPNNNNR